MKPWSASLGAQQKTSANPPTSTATVTSESVFSPRPNTASFLQQEVEDRVGEQPEHEIIEAEGEQPASFERARATGGQQRRGGARARDDQGDGQRQREQRPEQIARAG